MSRWAAWQCPECGHEEKQLARAVMVAHRCRQVRRIVKFVRQPEPVNLAERLQDDPKNRRSDV
jgi:hypothetical protein